jgi:hypothetical protein
VVAGIGGFTFIYARGYSYMTDDKGKGEGRRRS